MINEEKILGEIKKVGKVLDALTDLALRLGTLLAVIKLLVDTIRGGL